MADAWHYFPPFMLTFFEEMVTVPFRDHPETPAWRAEVLTNSYVPYHTNTILRRGTVNFEDGHRGLTPDDMVIVYRYYMMQKHASCMFRLFDVASPIFGNASACADRVVTVDFGCGPATWSVAMGWYYLSLSGENPPRDRIRLRYIGIDQSQAAIRSALAVTAYDRLFLPDSLRSFFMPGETAAYIDRIGEYIREAEIADPLIVLNFSFFFSSPTLEVRPLANTVREILDRYSQHKVCLTFQNPPEADNSKWDEFRAAFRDLHLIRHSEPGWHDRVYYNDTTGRSRFNGHSSRLLFFILSNRSKDLLVGARA